MRSANSILGSPDFFETVVSCLMAGVVVIDETGQFVFFNPRATELTGVGIQDISPEKWASHFGVFELDGVTPFPTERMPLLRALQGEQVKRESQLLINPSHPQGIVLSVNASPLFDAKQKVIGAVAVFEDISADIALRNERENRRRMLEDEVQCRTCEIEKINEDLRRFSNVLCHDIKEPVRSMATYAQLISREAKENLDAEQREWIQQITGRADRLLSFIDGLLSLTHKPHDRRSQAEIELNEVITFVNSSLSDIIAENAAKISIGPLPRVVGDATSYIQLFQNLIINSLKHRADTAPQIEIESVQRESDWVFSIKDNGAGISKENHQAIFSLYFTVEDSGKAPGHGIGLATCRRIVERLGGKIWIDSELGQGTTFYFSLPKTIVVPAIQKDRIALNN